MRVLFVLQRKYRFRLPRLRSACAQTATSRALEISQRISVVCSSQAANSKRALPAYGLSPPDTCTKAVRFGGILSLAMTKKTVAVKASGGGGYTFADKVAAGLLAQML